MSTSHRRDPVTAISEAEATGRTAEIFADIREVMQIPLITSIWRVLADFDGGLEAAWTATRPIYETGRPDAALQKLKAQASFPVPAPLSVGRLESAGVPAEDLPAIRTIIDAYNRSNGMNLVALTALVTDPSTKPSSYTMPPPHAPWPKLRPLLAQNEIEPETWALLQRVKLLGASGDKSGLATLWRHLAHWPGLLSVALESYEPMQRDGAIAHASGQVSEIARAEAVGMAHLKSSTADIPADAWQTIVRYVDGPFRVSRMVTLGHGVAHWLATVE
jgi:hypothetical protein